MYEFDDEKNVTLCGSKRSMSENVAKIFGQVKKPEIILYELLLYTYLNRKIVNVKILMMAEY